MDFEEEKQLKVKKIMREIKERREKLNKFFSVPKELRVTNKFNKNEKWMF